jgi:CelD/BcsL family acetyltransferase involved in cellulose biosynthesis
MPERSTREPARVACPGPYTGPASMTPSPHTPIDTDEDVVARPIAFADITRQSWDRLLARSRSATPFSAWTFHRAWWDAYEATAHEQYLVCERRTTAGSDPGEPIAIVPLMHRHEVEPADALTATTLRRGHPGGSPVRPDAKAVFMAASYHADYATLLADPADLEPVARAVVRSLAGPPDAAHGSRHWDVVDLRRWRRDDPGLDALEAAFRDRAVDEGWEVRREHEDVCPVVDLGNEGWDGFLARLGRKARHEIRRKVRRAEGNGDVRFTFLKVEPESVERFIALHQARWGEEGLFPETEGGARSRRFLHRLAELEAAEGPKARLQLGEVSVGGRVVFATVGFDDGETCYFYNAGMDPSARELSPGVTGTASYLRDRIAAGRRRFDFLRGDEPYKYEWGAEDEPIERLLVLRTAS